MSYGGTDDDPTDFEGIYPVPGILPVNSSRPRKAPKENATTAAQAAGVRAFTAQAIAFYFRAPAKAFFRWVDLRSVTNVRVTNVCPLERESTIWLMHGICKLKMQP